MPPALWFNRRISNLILLRGGDLASGLTQVLSESGAQLPGSPITYLYGNGRIAQSQIVNQQSQMEYFLGDALGSVRQMTDPSTGSGQATSGAVTLAKNYDPYGQAAQSLGAASSSYGFTGEYQTGGMVYLRARMYAPSMGRFLSRDTWDGDANRPMSFNRWNYTEGNPINLTDPTGHCILTGIDTAACLIALAVGVPAIAGVTLAAWNAAVNQGLGLGGANQNNLGCADWQQALEAGANGSLGALSSEGQMVASIPLTPVYIIAALAYHETPDQVNLNILSNFGLDDEYRAALRNPYFFAGQQGGNAATTYISLATFFKGLPTLRLTSTPIYSPALQPGGLFAYKLILNLPGVEVIGGSGALSYIGTAGFASQFSMMSGGGGGNIDNPFGSLYGPNEGPPIALGRDDAASGYPGLEEFAEGMNAKYHPEWMENRLIPATQSDFKAAFESAMLRTQKVYMALDGEGWPDIIALKRSITWGADGFKPGNYTNAELYNILRNRTWYNKTTFYYQGQVVHLPFGGP